MKIISIEEGTFNKKCVVDGSYDGIVIMLEDLSTICFGISSEQSCCESFGYITSQDNYEDFIGCELLDCYLTTEDLCTIEDLPEIYEGGMTFFTIKTNKGDLQFVAYNEHNGYYSHDVVLIKGNNLVVQDWV